MAGKNGSPTIAARGTRLLPGIVLPPALEDVGAARRPDVDHVGRPVALPLLRGGGDLVQASVEHGLPVAEVLESQGQGVELVLDRRSWVILALQEGRQRFGRGRWTRRAVFLAGP